MHELFKQIESFLLIIRIVMHATSQLTTIVIKKEVFFLTNVTMSKYP